MKLYYLAILILVTVSSFGCSKYVGVSGKVTYADGTPVTVGQVAFSDDFFVGRGTIQPDGTYRMGHDRDGDGIPKGNYRVYLYDSVIYEEPPNGGSSIVKPQVAGKFANQETSGLTCEVKGKTVFNFQVDRP